MVYDIEPALQRGRARREPLSTIIDHATILGIVVCFVVLPIFGRPKKNEDEPISDFGKHIHAIAELQSRGANKDYAKEQIALYHQVVNRDRET